MRDLSVLLDRHRLSIYPRLIVGTYVLGLAFMCWRMTGFVDPKGTAIGYDFITFWSAGKLAWAGQAAAAFDIPTIQLVQEAALPGVEGVIPWHYPPTFHLIALLLATMPYVVAYLVFAVLSLVVFVAMVRPLVPWHQAGVLLLALPATFNCVVQGQNSFITAALLAGAIVHLDRRPVFAGVCIGLLAYKPQFGVLFPIVLALTGRWRVMGVAAATTASFCGLSILVFGVELWTAFLQNLSVVREFLDAGPMPWRKIPTVFGFLRMIDAAPAHAYLLHVLVAVPVAVTTVMVWWRGASADLAGATLVSGTMLLSPYLFDYELVILSIPLAVIAGVLAARGASSTEKLLLVALLFSPLVLVSVMEAVGLQLGALVLLATFVWSARLAFESTATERPAMVLGTSAA